MTLRPSRAVETARATVDNGDALARPPGCRVPPPGEATMPSAWSVHRLLACVCLVFALGGCGLLPQEPIGFRRYPLPDTSYDEAVELVQRVTKQFYTQRFGGSFSMQWDAPRSNLDLSPIESGSRQMTLFMHLIPSGDDTIVEMFAVVKSLDDGPGGTLQWVDPKQDVPLEETLYEAFLAARLDAAPSGG